MDGSGKQRRLDRSSLAGGRFPVRGARRPCVPTSGRYLTRHPSSRPRDGRAGHRTAIKPVPIAQAAQNPTPDTNRIRQPSLPGRRRIRRWIDPRWRFCHVPLGEVRDPATAGRLKRLGTQPGWPDLQFAGPDRQMAFLELKRRGGRLSEPQQAMRDHLIGCGFDYLCTDDVEVAIQWLKDRGILRGGFHVQSGRPRHVATERNRNRDLPGRHSARRCLLMWTHSASHSWWRHEPAPGGESVGA